MKSILVTATKESTGKTAIALALATLANERGQSVGYMKPKGTRLQSNVGKTLDQDPMLARELLGLDAEMHELEPIVYSPTFIDGAIRGRENPDDLRARIKEEYDSLAADKDLMVVEGGGSLTTGGIVGLTDPEVADVLDSEVVLVADYTQPGDIDEILAAADDIGDRLTGVLFNRVSDTAFDELDTDVIPFLESRDIPVLGAIPYEQELAGVTVSELATELGAKTLTSVDTDAFVERFLVGAMGGDEALRFFRRARDAAVITGGDRSEIHTAAIEAPGVKCLILTGGHRPSSAVLGRAEEEGKPVLALNTDTLTAVDRAEEIVRSGRTRDERTVEIMSELLSARADIGLLLDN
ncbi:phosphotransacetylase family protein [Natronocalculus amylovorans]|uniref:Phosphotransacetylase family protein n=1 Tax=Natronocalculus amylovorans TaxID=2917812 RepID=A0AAE3G0H8_9EURY|nr:phosphotransacetylase family protein [Natronocalculus amylovorans]MCL9818451.1 phosphotransacetylase family protein [Natronocalculus amylovorans]